MGRGHRVRVERVDHRAVLGRGGEGEVGDGVRKIGNRARERSS